MSDTTVARRYAGALYEEAERQQTVEQIDDDMATIEASLDGSRDLVRLFESPIIPRAKKATIVEALFAERLAPLTLRFLLLLVEKQREGLFPEMLRAYRALRDEQQGIVEATARVAEPLDAAEAQKLTAALESLTGKQVRLETQQDPSLMGGVIIRVGDTVYDGSVRHQLESLRAQLEHGDHRLN